MTHPTEPVAWLVEYPSGGGELNRNGPTLNDGERAKGFTETPLYAHPAPTEAEVERLIAAAKDCADDLESEINARTQGYDVYPSMHRKRERDMQAVYAVRKAIAAMGGGS